MAHTLTPLDAGTLLRLLTADAGRTMTPTEGVIVAQALTHLADAAANGMTSLELRQLAHQLRSTALLATELAERPEGSSLMHSGIGF